MKNVKNLFVCLLASSLLIFSCNKSEDVKPILEPKPLDQTLNLKAKELSQSSSDFGFDLFKTIESQGETEQNWMISPLSVSLALAMTYNGANADTKTAMENTLGFNELSADEVNSNLKQLSEALINVDDRVDVSIANSIWYKNGFNVLPEFISTNQNYYNAEVSSLDFSSSNAVDVINNWVKANTQNKIPTIVEQIDPNVVMYLINAIYFKGNWKYKFDASENIQSEFTYEDGSKQDIEMMTQKAKVKHLVNEEVDMVELPYGRGNWVMNIVLPIGANSTDDIIRNLSSSKWDTWVNSLSSPTDITLRIPPFKFEYKKTLNDMLKAMGMSIAFTGAADFSKMANADIYIDKVEHKTFIEVNEEGTEAAAVTSVSMKELIMPSEIFFICDKPFLFVIREQTTGTILFIGEVGNPQR